MSCLFSCLVRIFLKIKWHKKSFGLSYLPQFSNEQEVYMAAPVSSLRDVIPDCTKAVFEDGQYTLRFRTEHASAVFEGLFETLRKTDEAVKNHCQLVFPFGPRATNPAGYALDTTWIRVKFDVEFTNEVLMAKIASIYAAKARV
jgi:hypothetical protein